MMMTIPARHRRRPSCLTGFTLIELLVVVAVIAVLIGVLLPALGKARTSARSTQCLSHTKQLALGWTMYAQAHNGLSVPGRMAKEPGGTSNPDNWYEVGNGKKYRPRWAAAMGAFVGEYAFSQPSTTDDRQDYVSDVYVCPERTDWSDERNSAYGYNHQFLGNSRRTNGRFHNFPVNIYSSKMTNHANTVMFADTMGTAAGFSIDQRLPYDNDGTESAAMGNHGWSLDPPRLTERSDKGTGDAGSPRTAVDPRHAERSTAVFLDGHAQSMTPEELGYQRAPDGSFVDETAAGAMPVPPTNRLFSGSGKDTDPPDLP